MTQPHEQRSPARPSQPADLRSRYVDAAAMAWHPTDFPGIDMKILYADADSGMSTILFRMAPGSVVPLHEHTALEQTYILTGRLVDDEGEVGPGGFVWRPGGNIHIARAPEGATFLSVFMKPNRFFGGAKFFTD